MGHQFTVIQNNLKLFSCATMFETLSCTIRMMQQESYDLKLSQDHTPAGHIYVLKIILTNIILDCNA